MLPSMSALTFDTLSTELTQALSSQNDTPPQTTARCTLSREKVMVLVEYPLDSAKAERKAAQTLDWLEQHLREQFDITGLPEEMADVSEDDDEIAVQLYLKHLSESKPFRMRSFTWKVDDGFSELFGESGAIAIDPSPESDSLEAIDLENVTLEENTVTENGAVTNDTIEASVANSIDNLLLPEPNFPVELPEDEEALILSELEEEHLNLDIETELDSALELDDDLSKGLGNGIPNVPDFSASGADLDAALSEGVSFDPVVLPTSPAEFSLPGGDAIEVSSSELELPTVDLPESTTPTTDAVSSDFFTFDTESDSTVEKSQPSLAETDFSAVFVSPEENLALETLATNDREDNLFDVSTFTQPDETKSEKEMEIDTEQTTPIESEEQTPDELDELELEELEPREPTNIIVEQDDVIYLEHEEEREEDHEQEIQTEINSLESEEAEVEDSLTTALPDLALTDDENILQDLLLQDAVDEEVLPEEPFPEDVLPEERFPAELLDGEYLTEIEPVESTLPEGTDIEALFLDEALDDATLEDAEIDESLTEDVTLLIPEELIEKPTEGPIEGPTEEGEELPAIATEPFSLENDAFEEAAEAAPVTDTFVEEFASEISTDIEPEVDPEISALPSKTDKEIDLADALDLSALAAGYGLSDLSDVDSEDEQFQDEQFQDGAFENEYAQDQLVLEDEEAETTTDGDYYLDSESDTADDLADNEDVEYEYDSEEYDSEEYRDDPNYYLDGETVDDTAYEGDDVALIDEGEVQRQREQWQQQQSNGKPWLLFGTLGLVVVGALGYVLSRPCVFTQCDRIQTAQIKGDEAISNLRADASLNDVKASQGELRHAIRMLQPIPAWSSYHDEVEEILPEYEYQIESLDLVVKAQETAYEAAVMSQDPPHPVSKWQKIADKWRLAITALAEVPTDSPVRNLADDKLVEYRANLSNIVLRKETESLAEVSLRQAQQASTQATQAVETAQSLEDWQNALGFWENAITNLRQIPQGTEAYATAQGLLPEYDKAYQEVRERAERERSADVSLTRAKEFAADAQRAKTDAEWTLSVERWNSAIYQLNDVLKDSIAHSEVEALLSRYNSELVKAQESQQVALSFQPVEPSFYFVCGVDGSQRCTYSVQNDSVRVDIFEGYDAVIGQSITPPTQRGSVTPDPNFVNSGNELLQQITLLSTQAQLPVELYNAKGQFMARYKPELDGFVKEQG